MTLGAGTRIGPYEITGVLGVGGMGEVYRARDSALGREVALKVLPEAVAADRDRVARFSREARVLASLDHPNIGAIYGWEASTSVKAIVLELIEGPTLRDRIATRALPLDEALGIARQVADALEEAHDQGIVHRDLKPANIKVRPDGRVKVLDFGLAKALEDDATTDERATTGFAATQAGIVVGTPAYMSPEQARGEKVTRKTDVWSFGIVLFEMLAGRHPFGSGGSTEVVAAILRATPEWEALPAGTPPAVTRLLRRCLEKDPRSRIHDIGDARLEIEDAISGRSSSPSGASHAAGATRGGSLGVRIAAVVGAVAILGAAVTAAYVLGARHSTSQPAEVRLSIVAPFGTRFASTPAVSPDGRAIAFVAATPGSGGQLYVRPLASAGASTPLPGTDGATFPFWSRNGRSLGFFAGQKLWRVDVGGADRPTKICDVTAGRGGTWLDDHTIIFADAFAPLSRVPDSGGQPTAFTTINKDAGEVDHRFPSWIPGGYLLYLVFKDAQTSAVRLVALGAPNQALKSYPGIAAAEYDDGFFVFHGTDQVKARRMHLPDGELGPEVAIGAARTSVSAGRAAFSSSAGVMAFVDSGEPTLGQFVWRGRDGSTTGTLGEPGANNGVELSPDRQELVTSVDGLSVMDVTQPAVLNPAFKGQAQFPLWSSDGSEVLFMGVSGVAPNTGKAALLSISRTGNRPPTNRTPPATVWVKPVAWTRGGALVWLQQGNGHDWDLWTKRLDQQPAAYLQNGARNAEGRLSPDGSWLAYASDQSGRFEIVVQSFPSPDRRIPVSSDGGRFPRWRPDGRELYYLTRDFAALMAVSVTPGSLPKFGAPHKLFDVRLVTTTDPEQIVFGTYQYDVADAAGTRFLINQLVREPVQALDVILNWNQK